MGSFYLFIYSFKGSQKKKHCDDFVEMFSNSPSNKLGLWCLLIKAGFDQNALRSSQEG